MDFKKYILNAIDGDPDNKDWILPPVGFATALSATRTKASTKQTRRGNIAVVNQGSEGTCVGQSGYAVFGDTPENKGVILSSRWIYEKGKIHDQWKGEDYSGTSISGACKALLKEGCCKEMYWPYKINDKTTGPLPGAEEDATTRKIYAYYKITPDRIDDIKALLLNESLWFSFKVHDKFYETGSDGLIPSDGYLESAFKGGHACAIIGCNELNGKLYFEGINSWGEHWGNNGFFFIEHELLGRIIHGGVYYLVTQKEEAQRLEEERLKKEKKLLEDKNRKSVQKLNWIERIMKYFRNFLRKIIG